MPEKPTYQFYVDEYLGNLSEEAFKASLRTGISKVDYIIFPNEVTSDRLTTYQMAICAAIDVDAAYGASGGIGETSGGISIGSFSASERTGNTSDESLYDKDMKKAIREHLSGSGLLYMGIA